MSEEQDNILKTTFCIGCLSKNNEIPLYSYKIQNETLKGIFQVQEISLCFLCRRIAQKVELFIQNVQSNEILLENFHVVTDSTINTIKTSISPLSNLSCYTTDPIYLDGNDKITENCVVICNSNVDVVNIKLELKTEDDEIGDYDADDNDLETCVKEEEEDEYPLKLLKQELELEGINIKCLKKSRKKGRLKRKVKTNNGSKKGTLLTKTEPKLEVLVISTEQCLEEREQKRLDPEYFNKQYKCESCVKGFTYKTSFVKHLELHSESNGDYECDICKIRLTTQDKINEHIKKTHCTRYKCIVCGIIRSSRISIEDHYSAYHTLDQYSCHFCFKVFKRRVSLRKHVTLVHKPKQKVQCEHCSKVYSSQDSLRTHSINKHPNIMSDRKILKNHVCGECGASFASPSQLKLHSRRHSDARDYYCVECDKSFKSDYILKHHLKTTVSHTKYMDLPLPCDRCDKRFAIKRDLERHMNRIHLNIRPFQCDQCEKAYVNNWTLTEHRRLAHEGYKRPRRYPCTMCDKIFDRNHILKAHIRTHTGERPYQCSSCPAQFSQAGILGTHVKLIHLKRTRDGRPKPGSVGVK